MSKTTCNWGILGTATIARKNWQAIRDAGNAKLIAVASRNAAKAAAFVDECQASAPHAAKPEALGSYEALLARSDVDAVYIPLPTGLRKEWVLRAAAAGKHVLVEKPIACTAADAEEMIAACDKAGVQFMDGVMFMHSLRMPEVRAALDDGTVGALRRITSQFSFPGDDQFMKTNIRVNPQLEPLGCLGDLGWYCIRLSLWAMNYQEPEQATGRILKSIDGVPVEFSGELVFPNNVTASFYNSFATGHQQWANLGGEAGHLHIPDFVLPFHGGISKFGVTRSDFQVKGCQFDMHEGLQVSKLTVDSSNGPTSQEANMVRTFSQLVNSGKLDHSWAKIALQTQRVLDACLKAAQ